jgi:hypothetical protein
MSQAETVMIDSTPEKRITEIIFHGGDWNTDAAIRRVIETAADEHEPNAILLNLTDFRYHGGQHVSGFLTAFFNLATRTKRPACFLGAAPNLRPVFNAIDPSGVFNVRYFDDRVEAVRYLRTRLETAGPQGRRE